MDLFAILFRAVFSRRTLHLTVCTKSAQNADIFLLQGRIRNAFFSEMTGKTALYCLLREEIDSISETPFFDPNKISSEIEEDSQELLLRFSAPTPLPLPTSRTFRTSPSTFSSGSNDLPYAPATSSSLPTPFAGGLAQGIHPPYAPATSGSLPTLVDPSSLLSPSYDVQTPFFFETSQDEFLAYKTPIPEDFPPEIPTTLDQLFFRFLSCLIEKDLPNARKALQEALLLAPHDERLQRRWLRHVVAHEKSL